MFEDAFYKHLMGFFDYALISCQSPNMPNWLLAKSMWPLIFVMASYTIFVWRTVPRILRTRRPMEARKFLRVYTWFQVFSLACNCYINFNTMVEITKASKPGAKLALVKDCNVCSCLLAMWFTVVHQMIQIYGDAVLKVLEGRRTNCVLALFNVLRPLNAWLGFQFYTREAAIFANLVSTGEFITIAFGLMHRWGNRVARSISDTPDLVLATVAQSMMNSTVAALMLIITRDFEQRLLWWNMEYNFVNLVLLGLLCGWREFKVCLTFIALTISEFIVVGMYTVNYGIPRQGLPCIRDCTTEVAKANVPDIGAESGVVGPVQ